MKLKRLILQGFKSFKDRTTIHFDKGITGIVGPNGCGKSNVVDALFWVMGEQSAKHLRGNTMKDVIFAGSSKYTPGAFAEVSLVLENDDGKHIHIGNHVSSPVEIQLTRKLYRNGETEYRINDVPCRLKDIQEVFMDTGAGAKSYSIIAQGEINRLVQAKPEERRVMIEEVAGITKFKMRKRESLKKIELTEQNLGRLKDLQIEIEKNLKSLERQAEKAVKARELKEKVKRYDLIVSSHREMELLQSYTVGENRLTQIIEENEQYIQKKSTIEIGLEEERYRKDEESSKIEDLQKEYNEKSRTLAAKEERLIYLNKALTEKINLMATREKEKESIKQELGERIQKRETLSIELENIEKNSQEEIDLTFYEERTSTLKDELDLKKSSLADLAKEVSGLKAESDKLSQEIFRNNSKKEEYSNALQDSTVEIELLEKEYAGVNSSLKVLREEVEVELDRYTKLAEVEKEKKEELGRLLKDKDSNEKLIWSTTKEHINAEAKLDSLQNLALNSNKDYNCHSEIVAKNESDCFVFGSLFTADKMFGPAIQKLLGPWSDSLLSTIDISSKLSGNFSFLKINHSERPSPESRERLALIFGKLKSLDEIVCINEKLIENENLRLFLSRFYVVEGNYDEASDLSKINSVSSELNFLGITFLNAKLKISKIGSLLEFESHELSEEAGFVARNLQIEKLTLEVNELKEKLQIETAMAQVLLEKISLAQIEYENLRSEVFELKSSYTSKDLALKEKLKSFDIGSGRLEILKNRKAETSKLRLAILENEEKNAERFEDISSELEIKTERMECFQEELADYTSAYEDARDELKSKELELKSFASRLSSAQAQIDDLNLQITRLETRKSNIDSSLDANHNEIENYNKEITELRSSNQNISTELADQEDVLNILKDNFAQLLISMKDREDEVRELNSKANKNNKELIELEIKLTQCVSEEEQVVRNIFEKYRIDLRDTMKVNLQISSEKLSHLKDLSSMYISETLEGPIQIEVEPYTFTRRYGADLKEAQEKLKNYRGEFSRLGDINWQAIEDYDRQKLRADFLQQQEQELKLSLEDLKSAIAHIDEKSKVRFQAAYDEVNVRFQKVFPIIFGGGTADLKIIGDLNDPECGIDIIASPPGKKMQNINLMSGGEKAMTAVSLIFSIFLVKPSPFCLLDEVDAPLDDANVGRFNELLREMSGDSQFILITHNKKTMELNDTLYGVTMQEPGVSKAVSVQLH